MTLSMIFVLTVLVCTIILFITEWLRTDVTALLVLTILGLSGILSPQQAFAGFSSSAIISIIAVMIIGAGIDRVGLSNYLAQLILKLGGRSESRLIAAHAFSAGLLASFLRNVGAVALLMPVISRISMRTQTSKSRLLMPVAFCAIIGGTVTMVGSGPLIILNEFMASAGHGEQYHLFSVAPVGLALLIAAVLFFALFARHWLPVTKEKRFGVRKTYFRNTYGIGGQFFELTITPNSPLIGMSLKELETKIHNNIAIIGLYNEKEITSPPLRKSILKAHFKLACLADEKRISDFAKEFNLAIEPRLKKFAEVLSPARTGLSEVVIPPSSDLIGQQVKKLKMRRTHGLQLLAVLRGKTSRLGDEMKAMTLRAGDTLGVFSPWQDLSRLEKNESYLVITSDYPKEHQHLEKRWYALAIALFTLVLVILPAVPEPLSLMTGAVLMIVTGCIPIEIAYQSISWRTVFLLAGLIPLGTALQITGTAQWLTQGIIDLLHGWSTLEIAFLIGIITTFATLVMTNVGATLLLVPIVIHLATETGADPRLFALIVAVCASNSFLLPSHQVNTLITGPGGYRVSDFIKIGSVMTVIFLIIAIPVLYWTT
ncbi:Na(+)/dicarboxylate symporter [Piscirickettsia salmonis]|uniref:Citrate transporter family protein n=1 Tax=Piscirickettsia salmonis TaxID=1238 RepID=A0AAC8VG94_PISSA|nr:SLC13 family permease [Piscirickettsia salmonis]ALB21819.1 citrate transporter family protein [Piscirickettsia salmonis]KLV36453.1 citrate transporter family protein [Piscirickettsia salmonis]QGN99564.1 Na(+)/dicarboxylate symporter [Piscirickettsia salmonis]QGO03212.1 Na(+)/dicarboxylate symporter [Piscirickettsia salmonis]QGO13851.1 Na(+)/dicarboxylate symporter [Piscirickettsia salmonis]